MNAKKKAANDKKTVQLGLRVTPIVAEEISLLADKHGYEDNRNKFIELAARGMIVVDRKRAGLD